MECTKMSDLTPIQKFYYGKNVFITGVTGFVGKILLEKLLFSCDGIGTCYVMMREKRGKSVEERLETIFKKELFDRLKRKLPDFKEKVAVVYGNLLQPRFGIKDEDCEMLKANVAVVFHCAARVNWADNLKSASAHNIQPVYALCEMLHEFRKLEAFVHVSTLTCNIEEDGIVRERVRKKEISPRCLLDALECLDEDGVKDLTQHILKEEIVYSFSKSMAEIAIVEEHGDIPTALVRPAIVMGCLKEPLTGWGDTLQGLQAIALAASKGFLRTFYMECDMKSLVVPADTVINCMIAAAWEISNTVPKDVLVLNCVIEKDKSLTYFDLITTMLSAEKEYPLVNLFRCPDFTIHYSRIAYCTHALFDEWIPAFIGDTLLYLVTGKTILCKTYRKLRLAMDTITKVGKRIVGFETKNYYSLQHKLSQADARIFYLALDDIDLTQYIYDMVFSGRKELAKEDPSTIPYAKQKRKIWWFTTTCLKWTLILGFLNFFVMPRLGISVSDLSLVV